MKRRDLEKLKESVDERSKENVVNFKRLKYVITTSIVLLVCIVTAIVICFTNKEKMEYTPTGEIARSMTYKKVKPEDKKVSGTENVQFDAFFLRDLNGDGEAEGIRGSSRKIGEEDTLYIELNVLTGGHLENGEIIINNDNIYLQTAIPKDSEIKENAIGTNIKQIKLETINNGTQKLLTGIVRSGDYTKESQKTAAIGNNTKKYSSSKNSVTLKGTFVPDGEGESIQIEKTVEFTVDWHGYTGAVIRSLTKEEREKNIQTAIDEGKGELHLDFTIRTDETENELILKKTVLEGKVPELSGIKPQKVELISGSGTLTYNAGDDTFKIERESTRDEETGIVTNVIPRDYTKGNKYDIRITYPIEAYREIEEDTVEIRIPVTVYYEGYNNENKEFRNPEKSNIAKATLVVTYRNPQGDVARVDVTVGKYVSSPSPRYIVSKEKPLKIYNGMSSEEKNDNYIVRWEIYTGIGMNGKSITLKENNNDTEKQKEDEFITATAQSESMEGLTTNVGIYFSNPESLLGKEGEIRVYDDETEELIKTFNKDNWYTYNESYPYMYERGIDHIRVETSGANKDASLYVYNVKRLDDEKIINKYGKENFDNLQHIKSTLNGYMGDSHINEDTANASYEAPYAIAEVTIDKQSLSTQTTEKNVKITIEAQANQNANQVKWRNGAFLLKLPQNIIDIEINEVKVSNNNVTVTSYEQYEEDGIKYIKINTTNEELATYNIIIDCNITPDPRKVTNTEKMYLYAYNENAVEYWKDAKTEDIYDINGNGNKKEIIGTDDISIDFVSPNSLLTNQTATNYDKEKSTTIAPQIAIVSKQQASADVNVEITNNYERTISQVVIVGRIPYQGNKYTINGSNMDSTFNTTLNGAIVLPDKLKGVAKVYYSKNGEATKEVKKPENEWKEASALNGDFSEIKSYLIDLGDYQLEREETHKFTYTINMPEEVEYNQISYSHHAVYFSLDTTEGTYPTQTEPNKLGFMIAKKYDLELIKYQKGKEDVTVANATYLIREEDSDNEQEGKTRTTIADGKLTLKDLYVDKTYIVKEIKSPSDYELNETEFKFKVKEENGQLQIEEGVTSGNPKSITVEQVGEGKYKVVLKVEDEVKAKLKITKLEKGETEKTLQGIRFKITGKNDKEGRSLITLSNGEVNLSGLRVNEVYTLEEIKANGYYLADPIRFKVVINEGTYEIKFVDERGVEEQKPAIVREGKVEEDNNIPVIKLKIDNEKIPTYTLKINKVKKGTEEGLLGAKFRLYKGTEKIGDYTTEADGTITIENLYQYEANRGIDQTYTLKEIISPEGYAQVKDITFKVRKGENETLVMDIEGGKIEKQEGDTSTITITIEDSPSFKLIKKDGEKADKGEEGEEVFLPNTKFAIYNIENGEDQIALDAKNNILGNKEIIDGKEYYVLTTNAKGEIEANLREGLYKAVEIKASEEKYEITDNVYYFGIGASRETTEVTEVTWATAIGGSNYDYINCVAETADGGILVGGRFNSSELKVSDQYTLKNAGQYDGFVIKYNPKGEVEWATAVEGTSNDEIYSVTETADGGILVGGDFNSSELKASDQYKLQNNGKKDGMVIKYIPDGKGKYEVEWAIAVGGSDEDSINSLTKTADGGILVGGSFSSSEIKVSDKYTLRNNGSYNGMVIKYIPDSKGKYEVEWATAVGGSDYDYIYSVAETVDGGIVVGGNFRSQNIQLSDQYTLKNKTSRNYSDGMVIKYIPDSKGEYKVEWATAVNGSDNDYIYSVAETVDGGFVVGGKFNSSEVKVSDQYTLKSNGNYDGMVIKYSKEGEVEWATAIGGTREDEICSLTETADGGIVVGGYFESQEFKISDQYTLQNAGQYDGFVIKYNPKGEVEWYTAVGWGQSDEIESVTGTADGGILVGGRFSDSEIKVSDQYTLKNNGNHEGMVIKYTKEELANPVVIRAQSVADQINTVEKTEDGGVIVGGKFYSAEMKLSDQYTLQNKGLTSSSEGMVIKYGVNSEVKWAASVGGSGSEEIETVLETADGGTVVGGYFTSQDLQVSEKYTLQNKGKNDVMVIKYDEEGEVEWAANIGGSDDDYITKIAETADGGVIVVGHYKSTELEVSDQYILENESNVEGMIIKYNKKGEVEWAKSIRGNGEEYITSVVATADKGFIVGGYFTSTEVKVSDQYILKNSDSENEGMIVKYNQEGEVEWATTVGGEYDDYIESVTETAEGKSLVGGHFESPEIQLTNQYILENSGTGNEGMIIEYNQEGEVEWATSLGGKADDYIYSVSETKDGGFVVGGYFESPKIPIDSHTTLTGTKDGMIIKYIPDDEEKYKVEWATSLGGSDEDRVLSVVGLDDGTVMAGGYFKSSSIEKDGKTLTNNGYNGYSAGMLLKVANYTGVPEVQEIEAKNYRKEFRITTDVKEVNGHKGGSITGEDANPFEIVKYGDSNTQAIEMTPENSEYEIISVTVNGKEWPFTVDGQGKYTIKVGDFSEVKENKHVVVTYARKANKMVIKKVKKGTETPITGVKFKLEKLEGETENVLETLIQETDSKGQITIDAEYGKYRLTEIETPKGYVKLEYPMILDFNSSQKSIKVVLPEDKEGEDIVQGKVTNGEFVIENEEAKKVIVHHYLKNEDGETTQTVAPSETKEGKAGEKYTTEPHLDLKKYELEKDEQGNPKTPENASGIFGENEDEGEGAIVVKYYYVEKKIPLIVHHYINGTEDPVPLVGYEEDESKVAKDEHYEGKENDGYTTEALTESKDESKSDKQQLNAKYKLVGEPENAEGTYQYDEVVVTYYYEVKDSAGVVVKHVDENSEEEIAPRDILPEEGRGKVGDPYTTNPSTEIPPNYELKEEPKNKEGTMEEGETEVVYKYGLKDPEVKEQKVDKNGPETIKGPREELEYTINYTATIAEYIGKVQITIVDELPYHIDEKESELNGGTYDSEHKTITWKEIREINTYTDGEEVGEKKQYTININKEIKIVYKDNDVEAENITNKVKGNIKFYTPDKTGEEVTDEVITKQDFKTSIKVEKEWIDNNNKTNRRPEKIKIILKNEAAEPQEVAEHVLTMEENQKAENTNVWEYTFEDINKYNEDGSIAEYTIEEKAVEGGTLEYYQALVDNEQKKISNTYIGPDISGTKHAEIELTDGEEREYVVAGDTIKYTITVTNKGKVEGTATVTDDVPDGTSLVEGSIKVIGADKVEETKEDNALSEGIELTLKPNETKKVEFKVKVLALGEEETEKQIQNTAHIEDNNNSPEDDSEDNPISETITEYKSDLKVTKSNQPTGTVKVGDEITYTIELDNTNGTAPTTVKVKDNIPNGTDLVIGSIKVQEHKGDNLWQSDEKEYDQTNLENGIEVTIPENSKKRVQFKVKVQDLENGTKIPNTATIIDTIPEEDPQESTTNKVENTYVEADIAVNKTATPEFGRKYVTEGEKIKYTITITNDGDLEETVTVKDAIPDRTEFVDDSIEVLGAHDVKVNETYSKEDLIAGIPVEVEPQSTAKVIFEVRVLEIEEESGVMICNTATYKEPKKNPEDPEPEEKHTPEVKTPVMKYNKKAEITRNTEEKIDEGAVTAGDVIKYTITIKNISEEEATNIEVRDTIPEGTVLKEIYNDGHNNGDGEIVWTIARLNAGETTTVSFDVTVSYQSKDSKIKNVATVDGQETNPEETPYKEPQSKLTHSVEKSGDEKITDETAKVRYTLKYNATIKDFKGQAKITIVDTLPYPIDEMASSLNDGEYESTDDNTHTITWEETIEVDTYAELNNVIERIKNLELKYIYPEDQQLSGNINNNVEVTIELIQQEDDPEDLDNPQKEVVVKKDTVEDDHTAHVEIPAEVVVHHYLWDDNRGGKTEDKLVDDETIEGIVGKEYTTDPLTDEELDPNYECVNPDPEEDNHKGTMTKEPKEAVYYYKLKDPTIENSVDKTAEASIQEEREFETGQFEEDGRTPIKETRTVQVLTQEDGVVKYHIKQHVKIDKYKGKVTITITDKLPAKIDEDASKLQDGKYDEDAQTITWTEEREINTFDGGAYEETITKDIEIVYKDQNVLEALVNTVNAKVTLYNPESYTPDPNGERKTDEKEDTEVVEQRYTVDQEVEKVWDDNEDHKNKRPTSVTVELTADGLPTGNKAVLSDDNDWRATFNGLTKYGVSGNKIAYSVIETETLPGELAFYEAPTIMGENPIVVTNRYRTMQENVDAHIDKVGPEKITSSKEGVKYTITYNATLTAYVGDAKLKIVDYLPYHIDRAKSKLNGGTYDDNTKTITWEFSMNGINTYTNGNYPIQFSKEIELVFTDMEVTSSILSNKVDAILDLYETESSNTVTDTETTPVDIQGKLIVHYKDKATGEELTYEENGEQNKYQYEDEQKVGTPYVTDRKTIPDYVLDHVEGEEVGTYEEGTTEVTYWYKSDKSGGIDVKWVDEDGNDIVPPEHIPGEGEPGKVGDPYHTEPKDLDDYVLDYVEGEPDGILPEGEGEVVYHYKRRIGRVIVQYLEKGTEEELLPEKVEEYPVGDSYTTERERVPDYRRADPEPENKNGIVTKEDTYVKYYYERIPSGKVVTKHVDVETGEDILHPDEETGEYVPYEDEQEGYVGDSYTTEPEDIPYYKLVEELLPPNREGVFGEEDKEVIYYYVKQTFNFKVDKIITKATINGEEQKVLDGKLIKVEVVGSEMESTEVVITYKIRVENTGEIAGTTTVVEKLPKHFTIGKEAYNEWTKNKDGNLEAEVTLEPGETKEFTINLTWKKGSENFGREINTAEIKGFENDAHYEDKDKEDNISEAEVVMGVKTGAPIYIFFMVYSVVILMAIAEVIVYVRKVNINK